MLLAKLNAQSKVQRDHSLFTAVIYDQESYEHRQAIVELKERNYLLRNHGHHGHKCRNSTVFWCFFSAFQLNINNFNLINNLLRRTYVSSYRISITGCVEVKWIENESFCVALKQQQSFLLNIYALFDYRLHIYYPTITGYTRSVDMSWDGIGHYWFPWRLNKQISIPLYCYITLYVIDSCVYIIMCVKSYTYSDHGWCTDKADSEYANYTITNQYLQHQKNRAAAYIT